MNRNRRILTALTVLLTATVATGLPAFTAESADPPVRTDPPPVGRTASAPERRLPGVDSGSIAMRDILGPGDFETSLSRVRLFELSKDSRIDFTDDRTCDRIMLVREGGVTVTVDSTSYTLAADGMLSCPRGTSVAVANNTAAPARFLVIEAADRDNPSPAPQPTGKLSVTTLPLSREAIAPSFGAHDGRGDILFRRLLNPEAFATKMWVVSHAVLMPGATIGYHFHATREEVYFVLDGAGRVIGNGHEYDLGPGDCAVCSPGSAHGIANSGPGELELLVFSASVVKGTVTGERNLGDDLGRLLER